MTLTYTDIFCGAGGSSAGLRAAGLELRLAANHWARAIETHSANFVDADHLVADVSNYDMRRLPVTDVLWASPECTWHSPAGGRKRMRAQLDLLDDYVPDAAGVRSRATALDVIRATEVHRYRVVVVENVVEFAGWELFDWWITGMCSLGYSSQVVCVSSAHVGGPGNEHAPQWRDRLYVVFTRNGTPAPDVRPRPVAWCFDCDQLVRAVQSWKRAGRNVGKYGQQYVYRCSREQCRHGIVEPFVLPAATAIDWSDPGQRIGDRARPLAQATVRRIEAGLRMFAQPTVVAAAGNTYERPGSGYVRAWPAAESPLHARTATSGDGIASPVIASVNHGGEDGRAYLPGDRPLPARTTKIGDGIATPFILDRRDYHGPDGSRVRSVAEPMGTVTAAGRTVRTIVTPGSFVTKAYTPRGRDGQMCKSPDGEPLGAITSQDHHGLVQPFITMLRENSRPRDPDVEPLATLTVPPGAFIQKHHGGLDYQRIEHMTKDVADPLPSVVAKPNLSLVIPYRRGSRPYPAGSAPLGVVTTHEQQAVASIAVASIAVDVDDCYFRMLQPREHLRAQRFADDYIVTGNKSEQTMQAGNSVSSNVAQWIGEQIVQALA